MMWFKKQDGLDGYSLRDMFECSVGALTTILFFIVFRDSPIVIKPLYGIALTVLWLTLFYFGMIKFYSIKSTLKHLIFDYLVVLVLSTLASIIFGLLVPSQVFSMAFFGGTSVVLALVSLPAAIIFDIKNLRNVLSKWGDMGSFPVYETKAERIAHMCKLKYNGLDDIDKCIRINS